MEENSGSREVEQIVSQLRQCYAHLGNATRTKWNRDLPLDELLFDRWERAEQLGFKSKANIYHNSYVYGEVKVDECTWIGPFTLLDGSGGLTIGKYCSISSGVKIYTHDSVAWALSGGKQEYVKAPVSIGDCCHIGSDTVIVKGVSIGDHSVIGANSFVNRDLPPYSVAFGNPCRRRGDVVIDENGTVSLVMAKPDHSL